MKQRLERVMKNLRGCGNVQWAECEPYLQIVETFNAYCFEWGFYSKCQRVERGFKKLNEKNN